MRAHNVEFEIWERLTKTCRNPLEKAYLQLLTKRLKKYELERLNSYNAIAAITLRDANIYTRLGCKLPITDIPFGTDLTFEEVENTEVEFPSLFHLGAMDWKPNLEAVRWFLDNVWLKVHQRFPDLKFYIAGNNMPLWLKEGKFENVIVEGKIEDAIRYISSKAIMIVPLLSGSGMRVKIIEGMALGKTVVSTTVGAEGIRYEHAKNLLIANNPDEFLGMIGKCVEDKAFCQELGNNARTLVKEHYNNKRIAKKLVEFYENIGHTFKRDRKSVV